MAPAIEPLALSTPLVMRGLEGTARFSGSGAASDALGKVRASERETGPTITAVLEGGPLGGRRIEVDVVEGRPPKTIDVHADDASTCRYGLADWVQSGPSAVYAFLYRA
jgi:hypothetical protein